MKLPQRDVAEAIAELKNLPLLFAIFGIWAGGKTKSGLRIATGMQQVYGGDIRVIDTEAGRAREYSDQFKFTHVPFDPPHNALDYCAMIETCIKRGSKVIMIDSMSNEHSGIGGYLDTHAAEVERMIAEAARFNRRTTEGKVSARARILPAAQRKEFMRRLSDIYSKEAAFVFCFRGQEKLNFKKSEPQRGQQQQQQDDDEAAGKPVEMGYMPDTKASMLWMMTASALLLPRANGFPTWNPEKPGEKLMVKTGPDAFRQIFQMDRNPPPQLCEEHGRLMAERAKGSALRPPASSKVEVGGTVTADQKGDGNTAGTASGQMNAAEAKALADRAATLKAELQKAPSEEAVEAWWGHARAKKLRSELLRHPDATILEDLTLTREARIAELMEKSK